MKRALFLLALAGLTLAAGLAPAAQAATITVNSTAQSPGGAGDCTLGEAIQAANTDAMVDACAAGSGADIIMIPAGTYTLTAVASATSGGNGLPNATSVITLQGASAATTIIERSTAMGTPDFRFLSIPSGGVITVNDLTFRNGKVDANGGGAFLASSGGPLVFNRCVFDNNTTTGRGGVLSYPVLSAPLMVTDSVFSNNSASAEGGAISGITGADGPTMTFTNSLFSGNTSVLDGGAIRNRGNSTVVTDCSFIGNSSAGSGGAIAGEDTLQVTRTFFSGNQADFGGAIITVGEPTTITDSYFVGNSAPVGSGGAIHASNATVTGSTFESNTAPAGHGGAIFVGAIFTIRNSTFFANTAALEGGAIRANNSTFNNITVFRNRADIGGGISAVALANSVTVANSIIAGNTDVNNGAQPDCAFGPTSGGFNLIGNNGGCNFVAGMGDVVGTPGSPIDPVLGDLQDNGGITAGCNLAGCTPMTIPTIALLIGSPALEAGNPAAPGGAFPACQATDQRGNARPGGTTCDTGAFEDLTGVGVIPVVDLSLLMADNPDPVAVNANITYQVTVNNAGDPDPATDVLLTNMLPMGVTFVSATPNNLPFGSCMEAAGVVTCDLGTIDVAGSVVVDIVGTVTGAAGMMIVNSANVTTTGTDTDPTNDSAAATTTVTGGNVPPVANNDMFAINEDQVLNVAAPGVLMNDTDADNDPLTAVLDTSTLNGMLTLNADGSFAYTPNLNFNGMDSFTYHANDGTADSNIATVTLTINPANDPPSFTAGPNQTVLEDAGAQTVVGWATNLSPGPADEAAQTLAFVVTNDNNALFSAQPAVSSIGTLTYTPAANANGSASVTVTLMDNGGTANGGVDTSAAQMVTLSVTAVNDVPSFTAGPNQTAAAGAGAQTVNNWATALSAGPANESAQTLTFTVVNDNNAAFSVQPAVSSTGALTYTPSASAGGVATLTVTLMDNGGTANGGVDTSAAQMATLTVSNFSLGANPTMGTITAGQSFNSTITATAQFATYNANVAFSCGGTLPMGASCAFSPASLMSVPQAGAQVMFTFNTTARSTARLEAPGEPHRSAPSLALWFMVPGISLFGLALATGRPSKKRRFGFFALLAVALVMSTLLAGCGGSDEPMTTVTGTPAGTYNLSVTATSAGAQRTVNVTVIVQ